MTVSSSDAPHGAVGNPIDKALTGIRGLDEVLFGGIPRGRTTLISGGPGTGKTVFALESLYRGALAGEPGIFITFEEEADAVRRNALAIGWDLPALERDNLLALIQAPVPAAVVHSGDFDLRGLLAILSGKISQLGAQRVVIDAIDVLLRLFRSVHEQENQLFLLHDWLIHHRQTALLTVKTLGERTGTRQRLEYMVDCVLQLDHRVDGQVSTRRLRVLKYRGSPFMSNEFPYTIAAAGIRLMPISMSQLPAVAFGPRFSTGLPELDALVGGGFQQGSSILIAGATGTGKTILAATIALAACRRGQRVLYVSFEESAESLTASLRSVNLELDGPQCNDQLQLLTALPEEMGVEEHLWRIINAIDEFQPQHLILDAISATHRAGSEAAAFDLLIRLLTYCKARGVSCFFLNQTQPGEVPYHISGVGISSPVDGLIVLSQDWPGGVHRRHLLVYKLRGSAHSHDPHLFRITDHGIQIRRPAEKPHEEGP